MLGFEPRWPEPLKVVLLVMQNGAPKEASKSGMLLPLHHTTLRYLSVSKVSVSRSENSSVDNFEQLGFRNTSPRVESSEVQLKCFSTTVVGELKTL